MINEPNIKINYEKFKNKSILITGGTGSFGESLLNKYVKKIYLKK